MTDAAASVQADVIITSNYGEAGALDRFGVGLPPVVSGHNALADLGAPAADASTVLIVGWQGRAVPRWFEECAVMDTLENGVGVENEEQGAPLTVCAGPLEPWDTLWERFRHLD